MKDMHIDGFATAFKVFDAVLDDIARTQRASRCTNASCWDTDTNVEPVDEGRHYTISRVVPMQGATDSDFCTCGDSCSCANETKHKVFFDDILADVQQVIYNDPATIVTFSDGSKVCVKACDKDTFNKETGLVYALVKRLYANDAEESTGYLRSRGLGEKIAKLIKNATDQKDDKRRRRRKQKQAKKAAAKKADMANKVSEKAAKEACDQIYDEKTED